MAKKLYLHNLEIQKFLCGNIRRQVFEEGAQRVPKDPQNFTNWYLNMYSWRGALLCPLYAVKQYSKCELMV